MLEIKLFNPCWPLWPISGAKVVIIPFTVISTCSFDCPLCSKVFSGVSICSKPFRFVQKTTTRGCFFSVVSDGLNGQCGRIGLYGVDGNQPINPKLPKLPILPIITFPAYYPYLAHFQNFSSANPFSLDTSPP